MAIALGFTSGGILNRTIFTQMGLGNLQYYLLILSFDLLDLTFFTRMLFFIPLFCQSYIHISFQKDSFRPLGEKMRISFMESVYFDDVHY